MELRFKPGDRVRVVQAKLRTDLVSKVAYVRYVGPWVVGDRHPTGFYCLAGANDYLISFDPDTNNPEEFFACREANLEPA